MSIKRGSVALAGVSTSMSLDDAPPTVPQFPHLGRSAGHYEAEALVMETAGLHAGVFSTHIITSSPNSDQMTMVDAMFRTATYGRWSSLIRTPCARRSPAISSIATGRPIRQPLLR